MGGVHTVRRRAIAYGVESFFETASAIGRLHPLWRPERHGIRVTRDVRYSESRAPECALDVYRPADRAAPHPVVLYIHGGGFRILSKETHWWMALAYARAGYLVLNVGYRLAPSHPFPAAVSDVMDAYRWLVANAPALGADLRRIVLAGESAGANLATVLGLSTVYRRAEPFARAVFDAGVAPSAVVAACGIFQVSDSERFVRRNPRLNRAIAARIEDIEGAYLGANAPGHGAMLELADPITWLEQGGAPTRPLPSFFLPIGTRDPLLDDTHRLHAALAAKGADVDARYYHGGVHAFHAFPFFPIARRCWRDTFAFLDGRLSIG